MAWSPVLNAVLQWRSGIPPAGTERHMQGYERFSQKVINPITDIFVTSCDEAARGDSIFSQAMWLLV